jgi:hypothetical protein
MADNHEQQSYLEKFYKKGITMTAMTAMTSTTSSPVVVKTKDAIIQTVKKANDIYIIDKLSNKNILFLWMVALGYVYYLYSYVELYAPN